MPSVWKILVIDDDKSVLTSTACFLEDEGFTVAAVGTAEEGLNTLDTEAPDIAIVDLRLPGMDGNAFIREASRKQSNLHYIVMTGSAQYDIPDDLKELGITQNMVLKKPIEQMSVITELINAILDSGNK